MGGQINHIMGDSANDFSTERKEPKERTIAKPIANSTIGYSSRVSRVSSPDITGVEPPAIDLKQQAIDESLKAKAERRARYIRAAQIDDYVVGLVMEGLVHKDYFQRAAKVCTVLGLQTVNKLVLQVRQTDCTGPGQSKQKLLAVKMNGAIQLHYKIQLAEAERDGNVRRNAGGALQ